MLDIAEIERQWNSDDFSLPNSTIDDLIAEVKRLYADPAIADAAVLEKLRDDFAGRAMEAQFRNLNSRVPELFSSETYQQIAERAYGMADAMLAEKRKGRGPR